MGINRKIIVHNCPALCSSKHTFLNCLEVIKNSDKLVKCKDIEDCLIKRILKQTRIEEVKKLIETEVEDD